MNGRGLLSGITYLLATGVGIVAFLYPFWLPALQQSPYQQQAHAGDSALMLTVLVGLCLAVLLLEVQSQGVSTKTVALLGVLVAVNATLRFVEVAIPGPGGFSPIFPLIVLAGYVFGGRFGFLLGVLTLLVSAILTGRRWPVAALPDVCRRLGGAVGAAVPAAGAPAGRAGHQGRDRRAGRLWRLLGAALWRHHEHLVLALCHRAGTDVLAARHRPLGDVAALSHLLRRHVAHVGPGAAWWATCS